jgi:hypothetical protein
MTKKERRYLQNRVEFNKKIIEKVGKGELWSDVYTTEALRLAFIQGVSYVNDKLDSFVNG